MNQIKRIALILLVVIPGFALDHITKIIAKANLAGIPGYSYFFDTIRLQFTENPGAFLGMGSKLSPTVHMIFLMILPGIILTAILVYLIIDKKMNTQTIVAFSLILAGGASNLYDRIVNHRLVVDFLNMGIGPVFRTGIFNLADFYVVCGVCILALFSGTGQKKTTV